MLQVGPEQLQFALNIFNLPLNNFGLPLNNFSLPLKFCTIEQSLHTPLLSTAPNSCLFSWPASFNYKWLNNTLPPEKHGCHMVNRWKNHQKQKTELLMNLNLLWLCSSVCRSSSVSKFFTKLASIFVTFLGPFWLGIFLVIFLPLLAAPTFLKPSLESTMFRPASLSSHQRRSQGEFYVHFRPLRLVCKWWNWCCICSHESCY